ncbi:hypothetical protein Hthe01_21020 [Hydrogenophilus thermoluteolus]|uniref:hypothetical protein n=1 Tax=Hydrogenophilus thermoluteolus TaxID=297 RepID=UPI0024A3C1A1|nr:hypothetical protein [Hydrogenophilus thermoluteolus]GLW61753.1 hypothetical protein Hthe01_21020 [Hydrogenophilus thermoluteolus]
MGPDKYENDNWRQSLLDDEGFSWIRTKAEYVNVLLKERWIVDEEEWIRVASWVGLEDSMRCVPGKSRDEYLVEVNFHGTSSLIMEFQRRIDVVVVYHPFCKFRLAPMAGSARRSV